MRTITCLGLLASMFAPGCSSGYMRDATPSAPPDAQHAKVVFFRTDGLQTLSRVAVYDDDDLVGFVEPYSRIEYVCTPGRHMFFLAGTRGADAVLVADVAAERTYGVKVVLVDDPVRTTSDFAPVTRGSEASVSVLTTLKDLKCREMLPEKAGKYVGGKRGRAQQWWVTDAKKRLEGGKLEAAKLAVDDGFTEDR